MVTRDFNVSSRDSEKQKREEEQRQERIRAMEKGKERTQAEAMVRQRDHKLTLQKERDAERIKNRVEEETRKRVTPQPAMHLRPKGYAPDSHGQRVDHIRKEVERSLGRELAMVRGAFNAQQNRAIDEAISRAPEQPKRATEFAQNQRDMTTPARGWGRGEARERGAWGRKPTELENGRKPD